MRAVRGPAFGLTAVVAVLALAGCGFALFLGSSPWDPPLTTPYQRAAVLGSATGHQLKPVHAHNGRYSVSQVRHVVGVVGFTCKRSPTYAGLVILGCRIPGAPFELSAFISSPHYKGAILYGLNRIPGALYTKRRNVTLAYMPADRPLAQSVLSLMR
jgi:hypothetical protein